jgi:hypothetical protein
MRPVMLATFCMCVLVLAPAAWGQVEMYPKIKLEEQPLVWNELPSWMTLDMELRGRTEEQTSLGYVPGKDRLYELTRVYGGMQVRPASWMTGYLQFHDEHALGLPLRDVLPGMRDQFDLFQGYLNFHYKNVQAIAGRQLLIFGDERVIGISDWTNTSRSWDGFDLRLGNKNRLDLFSTSVVVDAPTSLNKHGAGLTFHGAWGNIATLVPKTSIQPFVLIHATRGVTSNQGVVGDRLEVTLGTYYQTKLPFGFDSSATGDIQRGDYSNDSIHAGAGIFRFGYAIPTAWSPHIEYQYDHASGNAHRDPFRYGTYDQENPSNHDAFGLVDLFGFQNIKQDRVNLSFDPTKKAQVLFQGGSLHLTTTKDTLYSGGGTSIFAVPAGGFTDDRVGTEFDASGKYYFTNFLVLDIGMGHFFSGSVMNEARHGAPLTLAYFQLTYKFKVNKHLLPR